jgi:hypothetical protein
MRPPCAKPGEVWRSVSRHPRFRGLGSWADCNGSIHAIAQRLVTLVAKRFVSFGEMKRFVFAILALDAKGKKYPRACTVMRPKLRRLASRRLPGPRIPELSSWPLPDASKRGLCSKARKKLHESAAKRLKSLHRVNLWAGPYRRGLVGQCSRRTANRNAVDRPNSIMPFSASMAPINCQCFARKTSAWP